MSDAVGGKVQFLYSGTELGEIFIISYSTNSLCVQYNSCQLFHRTTP